MKVECCKCVCGCNYKLVGYAANEDVCGACVTVCYEGDLGD